MQTKSVSLHFMVFIKGPRKGSRGKKRKKEKKKKRTETAGVKTPTKIFTAELRKFAKVIKNSRLYRYVTRTNVSFFDPILNDQRTEYSCA